MTIIRDLKSYAFGSRLKTLSDQLMNDVAKIYKEHHIDFEPRWFPFFQMLLRQTDLSIGQMAHEINQSHTAVVQEINTLDRKGLVSTKKDKKDNRKRLVSLTNKGRAMSEELIDVWKDIHLAAEKLLNESSPEFLPMLSKLEDALSEMSMFSRVKEMMMQTAIRNLEFVELNSMYEKEFKKLNEDWLEDHLEITSHDRKILTDPYKQIIQKGGKVFILVSKGKVVGTYTLQNGNKEYCELSKFTIKEEYRGWKIGELMLEHAINNAKILGFESILLFTHPALKKATRLYKKRGFKEIHEYPGFDDPTGRCSVIMQLNINPNK